MSVDLKPTFTQYIPTEAQTRLTYQWLPRAAALALTALVIACAPIASTNKKATTPSLEAPSTTVPSPDAKTLILPTVYPPTIPGHDLPGIPPTFEREDQDVKIQFFLPYGETQPSEGTLVYTFKPNTQRASVPSYDELRKDFFLFKINIDPRFRPGVRIAGGMGFANELQTRLAWDSLIATVDFRKSNTFRLTWEKDWKLIGSTWNGVPLPVKQPNSN